jgi:hypothetical protein
MASTDTKKQKTEHRTLLVPDAGREGERLIHQSHGIATLWQYSSQVVPKACDSVFSSSGENSLDAIYRTIPITTPRRLLNNPLWGNRYLVQVNHETNRTDFEPFAGHSGLF